MNINDFTTAKVDQSAKDSADAWELYLDAKDLTADARRAEEIALQNYLNKKQSEVALKNRLYYEQGAFEGGKSFARQILGIYS